MLSQNILYPRLGAAKTPYARSVRPATVRPAAQPDPGLIFDCIMARKTAKPHPNRISSMLFYLASIIIHGELPIYAKATVTNVHLLVFIPLPYLS